MKADGSYSTRPHRRQDPRDGNPLAMSPFHGIPIITPARFLGLHGDTSAAATDLHERNTTT